VDFALMRESDNLAEPQRDLAAGRPGNPIGWSALSAIRSPTRAIRPRRDESRPGYSFAASSSTTWKNVGSSVCAREASAAFYRLSLITSIAVGRS
jgi:hypothetical protein